MSVVLKTSTDFEDSISFLVSSMTEEMNTGIKYQTKVFNSEAFNTTFATIESRLNKMYEKTRVLEDVIAYTKEFVEQAIYETKQECRAILDVLEENRDKLKTNAYISYEVSFGEGNGAYTDRDGSTLPHCSVNNNTLTVSGQNATVIPIKSITKQKGYTPYKENLKDFVNGSVYRTFYMMDGQVTGGLLEDLYVELNSPTTINFLEIVPSNCIVSNVRYVNEDDSIEYEDGFQSIITRSRTIKAIQFSITCAGYKLKEYYIDSSRMSTDAWEKVKELEYDAAEGITAIGDLDEILGLTAFKAAYAEYVTAMDAYLAKLAAVNAYNQANGYTTTQSSYTDYLMLPSSIGDLAINKSPVNSDPYPTVEQGIRYGSES